MLLPFLLVSRLLVGAAMWLQKIKLSLGTMHSQNFQKYRRTLHPNKRRGRIQFDDLKIQYQKALKDFLHQTPGLQYRLLQVQ